MRKPGLGMAILAAAAVAGCGGVDKDSPAVDNSLARGSLVANPPSRVSIPQPDGSALPSLTPTVFATMLDATQPGVTQLTGTPKCTITTYYMKYGTVGGAGEKTDGTGAIMVPSGSDAACAGPRPVLLYAHGASADKSFNMSNLSANTEASFVAAMYAAQGFIVVAPNYAGYDDSSLPYHPFLNAEQQSNDMVDSLRAARQAFANIGAQDSGKLVIAGYSAGGFVAMATQRAMQQTYASEFKVTALAGMSGPYAMSLFSDAIFGGNPDLGSTLSVTMIATSWQKSYGGIYSNPSDIYEAQYATGIETLLPSTSPNTIFSSGKLPQFALFAADSLPQYPTVPGPQYPVIPGSFGSGNLIKTAYRNQYLADASANACNNTAPPYLPVNCSPATAFRKAAVKNDLRTYVPNVPVLLCYGHQDPDVFAQNTVAAAGYFEANGMPASLLTALDVDTTTPAGPYATAQAGFAQALAATKAAGGATAATYAYHGTVAPYCNAAARGFFQSVLNPA